MSTASPRPGPGAATLLATLTGADRPGLTAAVLAALDAPGAQVLDLQQLVVRGHLTLALLTAGGDPGAAEAALRAAAGDLGLDVRTSPGPAEGDVPPGPPGPRSHVTVLAPSLSPGALADVTRAIAAAGATIDAVRRLSSTPVTCLELDVRGAEPARLRRDLAARAVALGVDVAVSPAGLARHGRRLVVLDVDSTLITGEVIELLAARAGRAAEVAATTERAMRGELDFAASLHERVAALAGLDAAVLDQVRDEVTLTPGAAVLCDVLGRLGFTIALVSGGFAEVVEPLAASLGITRVRANRLEVVGGRLTGRVAGPVVDRAAKAAALRELAAAEQLPLSRTVAVGDGANDLDMIAAAGLGVAFCAKPVVAEQADAAITSPHLDSVLHLLGISREEVEEALREAPAAPAPPAPPAPADDLPAVVLRPLRRSDLPLLSRWLRDERVARWWADDPSPAAVERRYGPSIDGTDPTRVLVASLPAPPHATGAGGFHDDEDDEDDDDEAPGGRPFGLVQHYRLDDEPEYARELAALLPVPPGALSLDHLVGEADLQGRGYGPAAIAAALADAWARHPGAPEVLVPVAAGNRASWRALERVGFTRAAEGPLVPDNPVDPPDHVVMRLVRPAGTGGGMTP